VGDGDQGSGAWRVAPSDYLAARERHYAVPAAPTSVYVTMRDGCRLAVDAYVPQPVAARAPGERFPAIIVFTPYYRRFRVTGSGAEPTPNAAKYRDAFVPYGYALVVVDMRGTGASFGTRDALRSPKERDDCREIAEWVVGQAWCNGRLGATGISYLGAAACFLASTGHPAVKAIAPLFAVSDIYGEQLYPGGLLSKIWVTAYDGMMVALDHDRRDLLSAYPYFSDRRYAGPQPVDDDPEGTLLRQATAQHRDNFKLSDWAREFVYRDSRAVHDPALTTKACSPYGYVGEIRPDVAILSVSGWCDGAGYANGTIARFLTLDRNPRFLLLGPWDHGARTNVSPWRREVVPEFALMGELVRFFDRYLAQRDAGLEAEAPVHYFSVHGERWHAADSWPPPARPWVLYADADARLAETPPADTGSVRYQVSFATSTGRNTRYERLGAAAVETYYPDWAERSAGLLHFDTAPLDRPTAIAGHAIAHLALSCSEPDAALFVYLSEVEADGAVRYITEGMLRLLHRAERAAPSDYRTCWPYRSYDQADARLMTPGARETVAVPLLPIAWTLAAGSRLRVSIAGADEAHYPQVPHGRPPRLDFATGGADATRVTIPVRDA